MNEPLVSIIMPAYNAEKYVENAIESVLAQTYKNWELIICDDFSTDSTKKIINKYQNDKRILLIELKENKGAAVARNTAIKIASGEYIAFLDSDDLWESEKLKYQINFMIKNQYEFTCTYYNKIDEDGKKLNESIKQKEITDFSDLLKNCPGNSTVVYNANSLGKFYISDIKKRNDYLMWFKVLEKANNLYCCNHYLSSHRVIKNSLSNNKKTLVKYHWIIYKKELRLSFIKSCYLCFYWVSKGLKKYIKKKLHNN